MLSQDKKIEELYIKLEKKYDETKNDVYIELLDKIKDSIDNCPTKYKKEYVNLMTKIPWTDDNIAKIDINDSKSILQNSHYGMNDVKDNIIRYIACQITLGKAHGSVILLIGPPGVGKTSIAKSIADSMKRKFYKISLAGMNAAGDLRGFDSNYKAPKVGRIIQGLIDTNSKSPVILLDEIDKMGNGNINGNPEYVLIDILDSNRDNFHDNYVGVSIDLSNVIFIATANNIRSISPILLDRMKIINLSGFTKSEKICITKDYIIPKKKEKFKLNEIELDIDLIKYIVENYSNEAGVRNIEKTIDLLFESIVAAHCIELNKVYSNITIDDFNILLSKSYFSDSKTIDYNNSKPNKEKVRNNKKKLNRSYNKIFEINKSNIYKLEE